MVVAKDLGEERFDELVNSGRGKMPHSDEPPILEVEDLKVYFPLKKGMMRRTYDYVRAVDGISTRSTRARRLGWSGSPVAGKTDRASDPAARGADGRDGSVPTEPRE